MLKRVIGDSGEIVVFPSRTKAALAVIGSLVFVSGSVVMIVASRPGRFIVPSLFLIGLAGVVFFGACGMYGLFRLFVRRPVLIIYSLGITDNASVIGVGFVGWDEIAWVQEFEVSGQKMLGIYPRDLDTILSRVSKFKRLGILGNIRVGAAPITIPQLMLPMPMRDLVEEIALSACSRDLRV